MELRALLESRAASSRYVDPWTGLPYPASGTQGKEFDEGPTNPKALVRTFGRPESEIRVKLYRDHAAWCPYCHKVWLQLEEKRIPYRIEKINMRCYGDKPPSFTAKVPSGLLPVLELDGRIITESEVIMLTLEREFPDHRPLLPPENDSPLRTRATQLMRLERSMFSRWLNWLCSDFNQVSHKRVFEEGLALVEKALEESGGPFFLDTSDSPSMVDLVFAPFLERMCASLLYYKGYRMRGEGKYPALERWFVAMEARDTYVGTRSDHYTHCHDLPPQLGGCGLVEDGIPFAAAIDGLVPTSWRLPLPPLGPQSLEAYTATTTSKTGTDDDDDKEEEKEEDLHERLEAASRMIANHEALVSFACRGAGKKGSKPVGAPLSDPTAQPNNEVQLEVDAALRHVVHGLIVGVDAKQQQGASALRSVKVTELKEFDPALLDGQPVGPCLAYLRDRVGVPRDMRFPAARQLRAHLNWVADSV